MSEASGHLSVTSSRVYTTANYNQGQNFVLTAAHDDDLVDENVDINFTCSGGGYNSVTSTQNITINDDDSPGLVFTAQVATITEGNTGTFTVRLNSQPSSDVTLTATSSDCLLYTSDAADE